MEQTVAMRIKSKLTDALTPDVIEVKDESHLHAGHAGARAGGESHFRVFVVAPCFEGLSRVARQRLINGALREELKEQIHALAMKTLTPAEVAAAAAPDRD